MRSEVPEQPRFTRLVLGENEVRKKELNEVRMFSNGAGTRGSSGASEVRIQARIFPKWLWITWLVVGNCG